MIGLDLIDLKGMKRIFVQDRFGVTALIGKDAFYASGDDLLNAYHQRKQ